jgi:rsbT co-antagonist protein RsbR
VAGTPLTDIAALLNGHEPDILKDWTEAQLSDPRRSHLLNEAELRTHSRDFLGLFRAAAQRGSDDPMSRDWEDVRRSLEDLSRNRARAGFTPTQTASFIFSLKPALFARLRGMLADDPARVAEGVNLINGLLDPLGLYITEVHQLGREEVILRQQQEMLELSTPVVTLWEGVLALPLIGTLDSARTQVVMESLLHRIVETGAGIAVIDITGVPTVDTLVAQHLLKTVAAARLMGADCIISGIRPQIAQTIVHLGVELQDVMTKSTLADAFAVALRRLGLSVQRTAAAGAPPADPRAAQ